MGMTRDGDDDAEVGPRLHGVHLKRPRIRGVQHVLRRDCRTLLLIEVQWPGAQGRPRNFRTLRAVDTHVVYGTSGSECSALIVGQLPAIP